MVRVRHAPPAGTVAVNYEVRGGLLQQRDDGGVERRGNTAPYAGDVAGSADYRTFFDGCAHPLHGIADLAEARAILERAVAREFSLRVEPLFVHDAGAERETWFRQLEEGARRRLILPRRRRSSTPSCSRTRRSSTRNEC
jgi:hypothetical protein